MSEPVFPRISGVVLPESWELPGKPEGAPASVQDAYRQTAFQLGGDLRLLREGMNLLLRIVRDSSPSRYRTNAFAAATLLGTRGFLGVSDAALLVTRAAYTSCAPVVRTACECIAAATQLRAEELPAFEEWLARTLLPDDTHKALDAGMGQFFAGSTVAADPRFSNVYRGASELARPHIGASLVLTAVESNRQHLTPTFGDQTFHFGWAQLALGWLLALCDVQVRLIGDGGGVFNVTPERQAEAEDYCRRVNTALDGPARCRLELVTTDLGPRWLLSNLRRQAAGAPRRLLL